MCQTTHLKILGLVTFSDLTLTFTWAKYETISLVSTFVWSLEVHMRPVHGAPAVGLSPAVQNDSRRNDVIAKKALHEHNARQFCHGLSGWRFFSWAGASRREPKVTSVWRHTLVDADWLTVLSARASRGEPGRAGEKTPWTGLWKVLGETCNVWGHYSLQPENTRFWPLTWPWPDTWPQF